ncbi:uncharacterized protein LOC110460910 isoform X2 [Mizuhopecten yessoensis]|uniref:uncharacterized protein LOC110460910 isoform X2 n=1 Tax=Mizuhopecten yessoensis TaxID=6573 RepID=UPI000B458532|nr:uncharacterized protein LOC110460910 isoform X2 [Mizuhopecten yessoensis]
MIPKELFVLMVFVCVWTTAAASSTTMSATTAGDESTTTAAQATSSTTRSATPAGNDATTTAAQGPTSTTRSATTAGNDATTTAAQGPTIPSRPSNDSGEPSADCDREEARTCFMSFAKYVTIAVSVKGKHRSHICRMKEEALECEEKTKRCSEHMSSYLSLFHALMHHACGRGDMESFDSDKSGNSAEDFGSYDIDDVDWGKTGNSKSEESTNSGSREDDSGNRDSDSGSRDTDSGSQESGSRDSDSGSRDSDSGSREHKSGSRDSDSGSRDRKSGSRDSKSGSRDSDSGSRDSDSGSRDRDSGSRDRGMDSKSQEKEEKDSCSPTCDLQASAVCFLQFMEVFSQESITGICRQSMWSAKCMSAAVVGCQSAQKHAVMALVNKVMLTHDELCGSRSCELEKAAACLKEAGTTIEILLKQLTLAPLLCGNLKGALACVYNHTSNCEMSDFTSSEENSDESMERGGNPGRTDNSSMEDNSTSTESSTRPTNQMGDNSTVSRGNVSTTIGVTIDSTTRSGVDGIGDTASEENNGMSAEMLMIYLHTIGVTAYSICKEHTVGKDMMTGAWLGGDLAFSILLGSPYTRSKDVCGQVSIHKHSQMIMTGGNFEKCRNRNAGLFSSVSHNKVTSGWSGESGKTDSRESSGSTDTTDSQKSGSMGSRLASRSMESRTASGSMGSRPVSGSKESHQASGSMESRTASGSKGSRPGSGSMGSRQASGSMESHQASGSMESRPGSGSMGSRQASGSMESGENEEDYWEKYRYREDYFNDLSDDFLWGLHTDHKSSQQMFYHIIGDMCVDPRKEDAADCQSGSEEMMVTVSDATTTTATPTTARCEFDAGMACVLDSNVHEMALQVFLSTGTYKEAVREMCFEVHRTLTCAYDNIVGCEIYQKNLVIDAVHKLLYIVGNQCPDQIPSTTMPKPTTPPTPTRTPKCSEIKPKCRIGDIEEECFVSQSGVSASCDSYNATLHCVGDLVRPCQQMQTSVATYMLDNLRENLTGCSDDLTNFFELPYDDSSRLAECTLQAAREFRAAIRAAEEPTRRLCMTLWSFSKCYAGFDLPTATKYLLARSEALFNDFSYHHCMALEEEESVSVCDQPRIIGLCKAAMPRFFYNSTSQMCEPFSYGGCDGNDNNFDTITACQAQCVEVAALDDGCDMSKVSVCISTYLLKLFTKTFMPFSHQSLICSKYGEVNECVQESMMGCSTSAKLRHAHVLEMYQSVYQWACPLIRPEVPDIQSCLPHLAEASLQYFGVILSNAGNHNMNATCKELSHALSVVHATTFNCSDDQKDDVGDSLSSLRPLVGDLCPDITNILHCNSNSSYLVDDPETAEITQSCSTKPISCDVDTVLSCFDDRSNATTFCGNTAVAACISTRISGCQDSDISVVHQSLMMLSTTTAIDTGEVCDFDVTWPSTYDPERGAGNCTKQFYAGLEEKFLLETKPDNMVLCALFTRLMNCIDEESSTLPLVQQHLVQTLGSQMSSQLTELCQAAAVSPCEVGGPLKDETGDEYYCGRGSSGFCPEGSRCVISPTDTYAVCCVKVKNSTEKDCGSAPADLVFLVDESSSIGATDFQIQKDFVKNLINNPIIADNVKTGVMQVALVTFSRNPIKRFGLNTYNNTQDMDKTIDDIIYDKSGTEIEKGLKFVREVALSEAEGARSAAPKIVILITDGSSNDNSVSEANKLRDMFVTLLVIGVGNVDDDQLSAIAGDDTFKFTVADFSELSGIAEQFVASLPCPEEPLTCRLSEAEECYKGQAKSLLTGLYPIGARASVCSNTEGYAECVSTLTVTCSSEKRQKFLQVSDWTKKLVKTQAICDQPEDDKPKYCRQEEAARCLAAMSKTIARYQHTPLRTAICSQILTTETCVLKSIKDCDEEKHQSVLQAYQDMTTLARLACVAPQTPKPKLPDCDDEGQMCDDIEALNCMVSAHTKLVASKGNKETICNALVDAKHCVRRQIAGCEAREKTIIHAMYEKLVSRKGRTCPEIYCERCAALQCIEDLSTMIKKGEKEMCNMIESTKRCVRERAQHCSGEEQKKIYAKLDYVVMMTSSQCERVAMHCITAFNSASLEIIKYNQPSKSTDSSNISKQSGNHSGGSKASGDSGSKASKGSKESGSQSQDPRKKRSAKTSGSQSAANSASTSGSNSGSNSGEGSNTDSGMSGTSRQHSAEVDEDEIICDDQLDSDYMLDISWSVDLDTCSMDDTGSAESGSKSRNSGSKSGTSCEKSAPSSGSNSAGRPSASSESRSGSAQSAGSAPASGEKRSGSAQSAGSEPASGESRSGSAQSAGSAPASGKKRSGSAQSAGSAPASGESRSGSAQSAGSASASGESQSGSAQSAGSAPASGESQSGSASTSNENSNESNENSRGSGEAKMCMSRLAWMCKKARMSWECAQESLLILPADRQQVLRQALSGVWASVQYRCAASKLQCFSCQKDDSNEQCNARAVDTCAANKQACETVVDFGAKVITKGCVNPDSCQSQCTGNGNKCSYCCHGSLCNQPWDSVITEPRTCVGVSAVKCVFTLVKAVAHTKKLACSEIQTSLECVKKNTLTCVSSQYLAIKEQVSHLESSSLLTKCRLRQLHCHCGLCGSLALGITIQNNLRTDQSVCRHLEDTIEGTSLATIEQTCSPADFRASFLSLHLAWSVIGDTCKLDPGMNDTKDNTSSAESGTSSREAPSSGEGTSREDPGSGETICDKKAAIDCVDSDRARKEFIMAMMYGFERVCSLKDMWMGCVEEKVKSCSGDKYTEVWDHVMHATSWIRGHCQRITMGTTDKCDIDQAMQCLTSLRNMSSTTKMCESRNMTFECVKEHTLSCLSVQKAPVDFVIGELSFALENVCDIDMAIDDDPYSDIYHDLADCVVGFGHMIHRSMKVIGSNATTMLCEAVTHLQACLYDEKLPPLAKIYTKFMAKMSTSFMKHICSPDNMDRPLYCHSCDRRGEADCQSSTKLTICDPLTERCGSMSRTLEDGSVMYTKGCVSIDKCVTACQTSSNCSYCCGADFCNAGALPDVTITTQLPNIVTEQAVCGYSEADIVLLLDESSSIGQDNFFIMARFVNDIIEQLNIGEDSIHLGVATFSSQGHFGFSLDRYYDQSAMTDFVTQLANQYGDKSGTNVTAGLELVQSQIFDDSGNRPDVPDVILLLTDGEFYSGYESTVEGIRQANISVLVVGIGNDVVQSQLSEVASDPAYIFTVDDFNVLDAILGDLVQTIPCPPEPPSCVLHEAATCVSGPLVRLLVSPFTPLQYRHTLCSDLDMVEDCLSTSLVNCPLSNTNNMYKMTAWMKSVSSPMCLEWNPPVNDDTCDVATVEKCLNPLINKLSNKVLEGEICPTLDESLTCLHKVMTGNCSRDAVVSVSQTLHIVRGIVGDDCSTQLSESLCVLANSANLKGTCDTDKVDTCVQSFKDFLDGYTFFNTQEQLCEEHHTAQVCVEDNTATCNPSVRLSVETTISQKLSAVSKSVDSCEALKRCTLPGKCSIKNAFEVAVNELRKAPSCPSGNTLMPAISDEIIDCTSIQRYPAKADFLSLLSGCPPISLILPAAEDILVPLTLCIQNFYTAVNVSLYSYNLGVGDFCPAVRGISTCFQDFYDTLEEIPAKFLSSGLLKLTHQVWNEFLDSSCNRSELVICEDDTETMECPVGHVVDIQDAFYGREERLTCSDTNRLLTDTSCSSPVALDKYKEMCDNKTSCTVTASSSVTGDPCQGTYKYARITYTCAAANPVVITEADECRQENVVRCMNSFLSNTMLIGLFRLPDRIELCRSSLSLNTCISEGMVRCSPRLQQQYGHVQALGSSIISRGTNVCKEMGEEEEEEEEGDGMSCSPLQAWECIAKLGMDLSYYQTSKDRGDICRLAKYSADCAQRHLYNCTEPVNSVMSMTLNKVTHYALQMCDGHHRKQKDIAYSAPPTCVDPEVTGSHCNHVRALKSLADLFDEIFNPYGSQQRLCVEYANSLQSIYSNINGCPSYIKRNVLSGLDTVKAYKATDVCNVEIKSPCRPPPSNCKIQNAEACVDRLKVRLSGESSEVDDTVCSMRMEVKRCIDENTAECSKTAVYQVTQKYYAALQIIGTICDEGDGGGEGDGTSDGVDPEVTDIYGCIRSFDVKIFKVLELSSRSGEKESTENTGSKAESATVSGQNSGSASKPASGSASKPASGKASKPASRSTGGTSPGSASKPSSGSAGKTTELTSACGKVSASWTCIQTNLPRLAYHERVLLNHTLYAVYQTIDYSCKPQACHSCTELDDNDLCNKQHPVKCETGEVCYAKTVNKKLDKGCQSSVQCAHSCASNKDCGYCCTGYLCNKPAHIEDPPMCDVSRAVTCAMDVVSIVTKTDTITERVLSASLTCMETYSRDCTSDKLTIIYRVAKLIREMLTVSGCAAESSFYRHCGTVGVLSLGRISSSPFASDRTKCSLLNTTQTLLDEIKNSEQCFSTELAPVLKSMDEVKNNFIGDVCSAEDAQPRCRVDAVFSCFSIAADNFTMDGISLMNKPLCINSTIWQTNTCVLNKMAACSSLQKATISGLINMYVNVTKSSCSVSDVSESLQFISEPVTFDRDLELCIYDFSVAVTKGYHGAHTDVCDAYLTAMSCVEGLQLSPFQKAVGRSFVTLLSKGYDATYSCSSQTGSELVICEGDTDTMECPGGQVVDIQDAFYGREERLTCSDTNLPLTDTACSSPVALEKYKEMCDNKTSCTVTARNSVTGDPCVNTYKYARIAYNCVPVNPGSNDTSMIGSMELSDCDLDLTYLYLAHHTIQLYTSRLFTQSSVYDTCRNAAVIKSSVLTAVSSCASYSSLRTLLEFFDFAVSHVCVRDIPIVNGQEDPGQCNVDMAGKCFHTILPYLGATVKGTDSFCWELELLHECVQGYQQDCSATAFQSVTDSLAVVMTTFSGICPSFTPSGVCSVANALSCVDNLTESSTGCSNLGDVRACISTNMAGCSSLQDLVVRIYLIGSVSNRLKSCDEDLQGSDPVVKNLISSCIQSLNQNTTEFMNSNSPSTQTCDTLSDFIQCLEEKSKEMNIVVLNQALEKYRPMYTGMVNSCKASSKQFIHSGTCPVVEGGTCAEECFYDGECQRNEKCCFNGCGHTCVLAVDFRQ